jgi:hypothetical protein
VRGGPFRGVARFLILTFNGERPAAYKPTRKPSPKSTISK